jgi:hypothetical protein
MPAANTQETSDCANPSAGYRSGSGTGFLRDGSSSWRTAKIEWFDRFSLWVALWPLLAGFLSELRSFLGRMAEVRRGRLYALGTNRGLGSQRSQIASPVGDRLILDRIADTQQMTADHQAEAVLTGPRLTRPGTNRYLGSRDTQGRGCSEAHLSASSLHAGGPSLASGVDEESAVRSFIGGERQRARRFAIKTRCATAGWARANGVRE